MFYENGIIFCGWSVGEVCAECAAQAHGLANAPCMC